MLSGPSSRRSQPRRALSASGLGAFAGARVRRVEAPWRARRAGPRPRRATQRSGPARVQGHGQPPRRGPGAPRGRSRLRRKRSSSLELSWTTSRPSASTRAVVSARRNARMGRRTRRDPASLARIPPRPSKPAPRSRLSRTVSAWSSAVCPTRAPSGSTWSAPCEPTLEVRAGLHAYSDRLEAGPQHLRSGSHRASFVAAAGAQAVVDVQGVRPATGRHGEGKRGSGIGTAPNGTDHRLAGGGCQRARAGTEPEVGQLGLFEPAARSRPVSSRAAPATRRAARRSARAAREVELAGYAPHPHEVEVAAADEEPLPCLVQVGTRRHGAEDLPRRAGSAALSSASPATSHAGRRRASARSSPATQRSRGYRPESRQRLGPAPRPRRHRRPGPHRAGPLRPVRGLLAVAPLTGSSRLAAGALPRSQARRRHVRAGPGGRARLAGRHGAFRAPAAPRPPPPQPVGGRRERRA